MKREDDHVAIQREYHLVPFNWDTFPWQRDRFCIIVIANEMSTLLQRLFEYIMNSTFDEDILDYDFFNSKAKNANEINTKEDIEISNETKEATILHKIGKEFRDYRQSKKQLKSKLIITDLSENNIFKTIHPAVIGASSPSLPKWLKSSQQRTIVFPNSILKAAEQADKNYSHSIWIAKSVDEISSTLLTYANMTFILDQPQICRYLERRFNCRDIKIADDIIMVITSHTNLNQDLMSIPKSQFE
jgi:hypothetical protein